MDKIIDKLNELKVEFENLKILYYSKGEEKYNQMNSILRRIIDRTYPEKDAKGLKGELVNKFWILTGNETDEYWQNTYLDKLDRAMKVIGTIVEEYKLFGFDDFKPIKEKVETEVQVGSNKFGFWRKKKSTN